MRNCTKCNSTLDESEFSYKNKSKGQLNSWCKLCNRVYQREHYKANTELYKSKARVYEETNGGTLGKRLRAHHLSEDEYFELLGRYGGKCWICLRKDAVVIDHDHKCCDGDYSCGGCVRGVLCRTCNTAIGLLYEDSGTLNRAVEYLAD